MVATKAFLASSARRRSDSLDSGSISGRGPGEKGGDGTTMEFDALNLFFLKKSQSIPVAYG
jgi:hypothetical protein